MKKTAFLFSQPPFGNFLSKDGLDIALAVSLITNKTGFFFIGDGIFHLIKNKKSKNILLFDYTTKFSIFPMCGIDEFYSCENYLKDRGINKDYSFLVNLILLDQLSFKKKIDSFDCILNF
ncbi:sulfur transfer complex subunit [Buchnera aphidicola (Nipponaphis monzeni)]|uniref:Sulfur transfer complex subunit n=1 Tax=Buchnera aphidicola (Nipponaphis monzeni) TaxID=2495405 RepID=A0A455TAP4_9GAMM|nr:sulfurtransferase complex subunit TusC [Buchnera aphidicola]BBI01408.1 sulfur transfer complex subunit [Buchnera aphidicola (Nipponaphis monzeni)]